MEIQTQSYVKRTNKKQEALQEKTKGYGTHAFLRKSAAVQQMSTELAFAMHFYVWLYLSFVVETLSCPCDCWGLRIADKNSGSTF